MKKKILLINSISGILQTVITILLTLVSVPVFINKLGLEAYGIFAILSVIGNLNLLANLGLNSSLIVYLSKQGKCKESDYDVAVSFLVMLLVVIAFFLLSFFLREAIITDILGIPAKHYDVSERLYIYMLTANSFLFIGQIFGAIIDANQKIYLTNLFQFIYSLLYWGGLIFVVSTGGGLDNLGIIILIAAGVWFLLASTTSFIIWGKLDVSGIRDNFRRIIRKNISYGAKIYSAGLVSFAFEPLSKILLSKFIGVQAVAYFDISLKIKGQISSVFSKIFQPLFPYIAAHADNESLKEKINNLTIKTVLFIVPLVTLVIFTFQTLLAIWLGKNNPVELYYFVTSITAVYLLLSPPLMPAYIYLMAKNQAQKCLLLQFSSVIVNAAVFFLSYAYLDIYAIVFSNAAALLCSFILGLYYQKQILEFSIRNHGRELLKIAILGSILSAICFPLGFLLHNNISGFIVYFMIVCGISLITIRLLHMITREDINRYVGSHHTANRIAQYIFLRKSHISFH